MRAFRLLAPGRAAMVDVPVPTAGPGTLLIRVLAAGLCQTDLHICSASDSRTPDGTTLGHEIAGEVAAIGAGVSGWSVGERVVVHPCWSCGCCPACLSGRQNICRATSGRLAPPPTPGVTRDGGMAGYVVAPAGAAVRIGALDPVLAAPLTDAALTACHAIRDCGDRLGPGSTAVIIGAGGLGNMAAQILRATTATRIVILDSSPEALAASAPWSDIALDARGDDVAEAIVAATGGVGADVVLDFVGVAETIRIATGTVARGGAIRAVGLGGGRYEILARSAGNPLPREVSIACPYSGTYGDLAAVIALAQDGHIRPLVQTYPLEAVSEAMAALREGRVRGRAVLIPG